MSLSRAAVAVSALYSLTAAAANRTESSCFEYGVDYAGYDILTLSGVGSPSLCMESCAQSSDCGYWSWSSEANTCYLKSSAALLGRTESENIISGPRSCHAENICFVEGVDYVGYDVSRIEGQDVASAQACQELCMLEPKCAFFSYKASTKNCYLKSSSAPVGRTVDADVTSGPRTCSEDSFNPNLPSKSCAEGSVEYKGRDVAVMKSIRSASHCQQLCAANNACYYWTWDKTKNTCYQKDSHAIEFRQSNLYTIGKVSGAKDCYPVNPGCQLLDTTFLGTIVEQLKNSATFESCQHNCQVEDQCTHWTWDGRKKICQLRSSSPFGYVSDASTAGIIAGPKFCPNDDVCVEQADYVGHDIETINDVASAVECRTFCRQTEGCEFFTWVQSHGTCYLKNKDALVGKTNGLASLGRFSGPRECYMHYGCLEPNTAYLSPRTKKLKNISSYRECEQNCQPINCQQWTYLSNAKLCLLTSGKATKTPFDGALSGSDCKSSQTDEDHPFLFAGIRLKGNPINFAINNSVRHCHHMCATTDGCQTFSYEEGAGCYVYAEKFEDLPKYSSKFPTFTSGMMTSPPDSVGMENTCYTGHIIRGTTFYAFNDVECAAKCTLTADCYFWTYDPKKLDSCTLHEAQADFNSNCPGSYSGVKVLPVELFGASKYAAPVEEVTNALSMADCRSQATPSKPYWTWYPDNRCVLYPPGNYKRMADIEAISGNAELAKP